MAEHEGSGVPLSRDLRFVSRRRRRRGTTSLSLAVLLGLCAAGVWLHARLTRSPLWTVHSIAVSGNRSIEMNDLLDRLGLAPGMTWWSIRSRAAALVAAEPRLASIEVGWRWPRDLFVCVRERQSCLRLLTSPPLEVATDGVLFASDEDLDPLDLPLLTGALPPTLAPRQTLRLGPSGSEWREFLDLQSRSPAIWKRISEIHYAGGRDFRVYLRDGRRVVLWETGVNDPWKRTLPDVLADLERRNQSDVVVDLRFRDQIVLRLPEGALSDSSGQTATPAKATSAGTAPGRAAPAGGASNRVAQGRRRA